MSSEEKRMQRAFYDFGKILHGLKKKNKKISLTSWKALVVLQSSHFKMKTC